MRKYYKYYEDGDIIIFEGLNAHGMERKYYYDKSLKALTFEDSDDAFPWMCTEPFEFYYNQLDGALVGIIIGL